MAESIPEKALDLFQKPLLAHLATVMPDGTPQVTPVLINTSKNRQKALNMDRQPKVGLDIVDSANPWHWLSIRGHIAEATEEGANDHIDKMSKKYTGRDTYANHQPDDVRVLYKIETDRVIAS